MKRNIESNTKWFTFFNPDQPVTVSIPFVISVVILLCPSQCSATVGAYVTQTNLYKTTTGVHAGTAWGQFCFDLSIHQPTCGWKVIVSMNYKMYQCEHWQTTGQRIDDYTYELTNLHYNGDLTTRSGYCLTLTLRGDFWNTEPEVSVMFSCVCEGPLGTTCVAVPYVLLPPWDAATSTTIPSSTTDALSWTSVVMATNTAATVTAGDGQFSFGSLDEYKNFAANSLNSHKIRLIKFDTVCYTASSKVQVPFQVTDVSDCGGVCVAYDDCQGINYHSHSSVCELVTQEMEDALSAGLSSLPGCQFWDVVWKR